MKSKKIIWILLFLFSLVLVNAYPNLNGQRVNDFANVLTSNEEQLLTSEIYSIENNRSIQIAIVTVNGTNGEDRVTYANRIGDQNGVGHSSTDDGVIILWSTGYEQGGAIATGRGIESILNDAKVVRIGKENRYLFDNKQYYQGFHNILINISNEINSSNINNNNDININNNAKTLFIIILIVGGLFMLLFIIAINSDGSGGSFGGSSYIGSGSGGSFSSFGGGGFSGGSFGGGGGGF